MKPLLVKMLKTTSEMVTSKETNVISVNFQERFKVKDYSDAAIVYGSSPTTGDYSQEEKSSHLKLVKTNHLTLVQS